MKLHTVLLTTAASITLAACNPTPEAPAPAVPPAADIAAPTPDSGPAAPNTTDTLSSTTPAVDSAAVPPPAAAAPAAPAPKVSAEAAAATKAELANGSAVYARSCAMCHGPTGGGTAMGAAITTHDLALIKDKIARGMIKDGDKMPPMSAMISADDADDVAKFVAAGLSAQ